jgi:hypothetical protein
MVPIQNKSGTPKKTMATFGDASHLGWRATGRCRSRQVGRSRLERPFKAWHIGIQLQSSWNSPAYDIELDCSKHWWCGKKKLSERAFRFGLLEKCRTVTWECQVFCCKIGLYNYNQ